MFDRELIENRAMTEQACAFQPPYPEQIGDFLTGKQVRTGAQVQPDGSVVFRVYAPQVKNAVVHFTAFADVEVLLKKDGDGIFSGALPYEHRLRGPQDVEFWLDGQLYLHPQMPAHYRSFKLVNFVELPDEESEMILLRDVPHGQVVREVYFSNAMNSWERCLVYLPPQYRQDGASPVLYLQHGATENENEWVYMGKMPYILDNLIADGKAVPFIVVMNDGMERAPGEGMVDFATFERMLLEDCLPFIEKNYRVVADKAHRAMAGLSLGSMQTSAIGLTHPELFDYLGLFSGFMRFGTGVSTNFADWPHLAALAEDPGYIRDNYKLFFRAMGESDRFFEAFAEDSEQLAKLGSDKLPGYVARTYAGLTHDWGAFRRGLRDFAQLIFR